MLPRWLVLARWVWRATRADTLRYVVPRWLAVGLVMVELDVIVDWAKAAQELQALPPWVAGVAAAVAAFLIALDGRTLVRTALLGPRLGVVRRQPIGARPWGPAALAVLVPVAAPMGVLGAVWSHGRPTWVVLWVGLGLVPAVCGARRRWLPAACAGSGLVATLAVTTGAPALWAAGTWLAAIGIAGVAALAWADDRPHAAPALAPWRPRTATTALIHRDLLTLWRTERPLSSASVGAAAIVGGTAFLMDRSGDWAGSILTGGTMVALAAMGPLPLAALTAVARRLGRRLDPPEWPVSSLQRAGSLALVGAGLLAPGWAAAAVVAPTIGVGHVRIAALLAAIGAGAAWWVASRPSRPNPGTWPYWLAACLAAAWAPGAGFWAFALAGLALHRASRAFEARRGRP